MSRSGYNDGWESEDNSGYLYIGAVKSAINGKRGQAFLREALAALDAMHVKELAPNDLVTATGQVCMLGAVGVARGADMTKLDPDYSQEVADFFGIADAMAREIVYHNDEQGHRWEEFAGPPKSRWDHRRSYRVEETPAERWTRMRAWIAENIKQVTP